MIADLITIGGSAGSLQVILEILPRLRSDLSTSIVIIFHRKATPNPEILINLLALKSSLPIKEAEDKEKIKPGVIYIAAANYHLFVEKDHSFSLDASEKVNFSRPSIDLTFITAADVYKNHTMGILLSGANSDGIRGLEAIQSQGGYCIAQDPATSQVPYMPAKAISKKVVDHIATPAEIADIINNCKSTVS
ncbi:chemotaxis protein CheB [Albibacterium bauzanense]|uniref:protein-glutamate methylesterase n=1 Tax=Albibacterium bauzanense TaxID=653929 RepID=A0A4V2PXM6_9SPHI|nr:chemotaxis protein CheB [Albibacterium bauzanense]TCK82711.1 CheB methylesterase [Albibacterium bauzanense]